METPPKSEGGRVSTDKPVNAPDEDQLGFSEFAKHLARLSGVHDIAIQQGTIARIAPAISREEARRVIEANGLIVTPGLIDLHAHVFEGFTRFGVNPDIAGVTTIVDAGSSGSATFEGFTRHILPHCPAAPIIEFRLI